MRVRAAIWGSVMLCLATSSAAVATVNEGDGVLAKASTAFERNRLQEVHWNWVSVESRAITNGAGKVVQALPDVTIESVIRGDGSRCTAVRSWGDGVPAYLVNANPDARCLATDQQSVLEVSMLLKGRRVKLVSQSAAGIDLSITPDKAGLHSRVLEERCAASIRGTVQLDPATFFPRRVEGEVVEDGCNLVHMEKVYYDGPARQMQVRSSIHKGTTFRVEYELQHDKFQAPERSFWIPVRWQANILRWVQGGFYISWGRRFSITPIGTPQHIVEYIETTAQEFGTQSTFSLQDAGEKPRPEATKLIAAPPVAAPVAGSAPAAVSPVATALPPTPVPIAEKLAWLKENAVSIRSIDPRDQDFADLRPLAQSIGNARVVLLGGSRDATVGKAKERLVRFLHREMGFDILASDANLLDADELDRALDRGAGAPPDIMTAIAQTFASQASGAPPGPAAMPLWAPPEAGIDANPPRVTPPPVIPSPMQFTHSDLIDYVRATHKSGQPLHLAGFDAGIATRASPFTAGEYAKRLVQFAVRIDPRLIRSADRKMIESLLILSAKSRSDPAWRQEEEVWVSAKETIERLYAGLGHVPPNSRDAGEADFYRHTLADLEYSVFLKVGRLPQTRPLDTLTWIAKVWRPQNKIVVWATGGGGMDTRLSSVCRELGAAVYTIAFSEIKDDNGVLEVLAAGPQPALMPVDGDLESLLHAAGKPYSFVDFRGLPEDHWLRQPLMARSVGVSTSGLASLPKFYDGLISIDLTALQNKKK